jgi:hypothetical protein
MSGYVPSWIKLDSERFPRARTHQGVREHLSPFAAANRDADAAAFAVLMAHLAGAPEVVPMVQVQNEVGLLGDSRDRSRLAEAVHNWHVPPHVLAAIRASPTIPAHGEWVARGARESGTWRETLGDSLAADEAFMAAAYASYVDAVAAAGRTEFDVPMFVNARLDSEIDLDDGDGSQVAPRRRAVARHLSQRRATPAGRTDLAGRCPRTSTRSPPTSTSATSTRSVDATGRPTRHC